MGEQDIGLWFVGIGLLLYYFAYIGAEKEPHFYGKWPEVIGWLDFVGLLWWMVSSGNWALSPPALVYFFVLTENTIARNPDL